MKSLMHSTLLASLMISGAVLAADTAQIHFVGTISAPTCSMQTSNITIDIGQIDKTVFSGVGTVTPWSTRKDLVWQGCNAALVSMTFHGTADASDTRGFATTGGASGVSIQLDNGNGTEIVYPNDTTRPLIFSPATNGQSYGFIARYYQTQPSVTLGPANATITVMITYT